MSFIPFHPSDSLVGCSLSSPSFIGSGLIGLWLPRLRKMWLLLLFAATIAILPSSSASAVIITANNVLVGDGEGPEGAPFYLLPGMLVASDGSVLVFGEARPIGGHDPGNPSGGPIKLVMKRSTDRGATWSSLSVLHTNPPFDYSDPRPVLDASTGNVSLLYNQWPEACGIGCSGPGFSGLTTVLTFMQTSTDNGQTWSGPTDITTQVKESAWKALFNAGPGAGIQLQWQNNVARNGRMISTAVSITAGGSKNRPLYSDNGGVNWKAAGTAEFGGENTIVELIDGRLLMDIRSGSLGSAAPRRRAISTDSGETWGTPFLSDVVMTPVNASFLRYSAQRSGGDRERILLSGPLGDPPGAANGRSNMGIWTSYDEGKTFINPVQIDSGFGGYSVMQKLDDGTVGIAFDVYDSATFTGSNIRYVNFDLAAIEGFTHQASMMHYDGFDNDVDRKRGGVGWSGPWEGNGNFTDTSEAAFGGASSIPFTGMRFSTLNGRVDLVEGVPGSVARNLAGQTLLDRNLATYYSMVISRELDGSPNDSTDEFFRVELRDSLGATQASFGVNSDESFFVDELGDAMTTSPNTFQTNDSYFLVSKIVSQDNSDSGNFDQIYLKAFRSGIDAIPDTDIGLDWTLVGTTNENSSALIESIALVSGFKATWSIDELRTGTTFGAVASNLSGSDFPNAVVGDVNQDGILSGDGSGPPETDDVTAFMKGWLSTTQGLPPLERVKLGDLNMNGRTDLGDVTILRDAFSAQGSSPAISVPEPSSGASVIIGGVIYLLVWVDKGRSRSFVHLSPVPTVQSVSHWTGRQ